MFEVFSDIYFIIYDLYYVGQNDDLGTRARPIHRDRGSTKGTSADKSLRIRLIITWWPPCKAPCLVQE
jgi:hypothetical protein